MEWTDEADTKLRQYLARPGYDIPVGLGSKEAACSMAAINLSLGFVLTDEPPDCMSEVIGRWIVAVQDRMPDGTRNSPGWRELLPLAAGTGREHETERIDMVLNWMFGTTLPLLQPLADERGFGILWRSMCVKRTEGAAVAARYAAWDSSSWSAAAASYAAEHALRSYHAAKVNLLASTDDSPPLFESGWATDAAQVVTVAIAIDKCAWGRVDPIGLLRKMIYLKP